MQVTDGEELLKKYKLNANDAILAGDEHATMYLYFIHPCFDDFINLKPSVQLR